MERIDYGNDLILIMATDLNAARDFMAESSISGWLTRDYRYTNPLFFAALGYRPSNLTRPVWLWIPSQGEPRVLAHDVDVNRFQRDIPEVSGYSSRQMMIESLRSLLPRSGKVATDYSPMFELPRVARVDAGTVELIRSFGVDVVSSGDIAQYATERWSEAQLASHRYANAELVDAVLEAFKFVGENVRWKLSEHDVAEFIRGRFDRSGLVTDEGPVVAFDANSSDPHYDPTPESSLVIRRDGWLLIDAWAKPASIDAFAEESDSAESEPVYADITWVAKIGGEPNPEQIQVFDSVRRSRDSAFEFMRDRHRRGEATRGWQVDRVARDSIAADGYGSRFVHRLGHSLGTEVHSNAVNLDDWETRDTRQLIPGICVTIEPGIYLPTFGVRLEMDVHVGEDEVEITGERQDRIIHIPTS